MSDKTEQRKKDHIDICYGENVGFKTKTSGFEKYDFEHLAVTEVVYDKIETSTQFLGYKLNFPFLISCMTGGTGDAEKINARLAESAAELKVAIGVGSQRQALENKEFIKSFSVIKEIAKDVPVLGNIGAAQVVQFQNPSDKIQELTEMINADAMVIHFNPLQELMQKEGDLVFTGILEKIKEISENLSIPIIAKEVGAGISKKAAELLLNAGVKGIDVAGAGGTSWAAVENLRNNNSCDENYFRDWGLPTSYCIRKINKLKSKHEFSLIASGGINSGIEIAKSIALGADIAASARSLFVEVIDNGSKGVNRLIGKWFDDLKKVMYLTGCSSVSELKEIKLIEKESLY